MIDEIKSIFDKLRFMFNFDIVLIHYDFEKRFLVETNVSDFVSEGVFSQYDENDVFRSVAFFFKKHNSAKYNYEIYNKKLMIIIRVFEE